MSGELVLVAALAAVAWFWWDSLNKRELAMKAARTVCQKAGVQLLDETVSLRRLGFERDDNQRMQFRREFSFEFSDTGDNRLPGYVYLLGGRVLQANLILPAAVESPDESN